MNNLGLLLFLGFAATAAAGEDEAVRRYEVYRPQVQHAVIYAGQSGAGRYAYNHMASVEWFDGRFHAVWGGNAATHLEGKPGQVNLWATSADFQQWSPPQPLAHVRPAALPADSRDVQWQPNLLNYHDRELWCVWTYNSPRADVEGLYLSTLQRGATTWKHRRVQRRQEVDGRLCSIFASQNPVLLASGRVLAPVTLNYREPKHETGEKTTGDAVRRWNACFYSDDGGATWKCSNPISAVDEPGAQWEPFFYEQADGRIRAFMRNFTKAIPPANQWRWTTLGTGAGLGAPLVFDPDPRLSFMETINCRPQVFRLPGGRYCLLQHDAAANHRDYSTRLNVALHFSRSGADDFVAAGPVSRPGVISAYPQGVAHGGKIYLAYTTGPGTGPRSIEGAIVAPAPAAQRYYVWPRSKELIRMQEVNDATGKRTVVRDNPDARTALPVQAAVDGRLALRFARRASAGVDLDPVDFAAGQTLEVWFQAMTLRLQAAGMLVLASLGDRIPIRLGVPANRLSKLYAYGRDQWQYVDEFPPDQWNSVRLTVSGTHFSVAVADRPARRFANPLVNPTPRLYLGDGFEVDYLSSNAGSEFLIDLAALRTQVHAAAAQRPAE